MTPEDWLVSQPWAGQDAYIIGGGSSLKNFDWNQLITLNTIGCNDAYKHGQAICKICVFGDLSWWQHHGKHLADFTGIVVSNACAMASEKPKWVHYYERRYDGLSRTELCWAGHTGSSAINLALILGAKNIYLLGFDMGIINGETNWHNEVIHPNAVLPSSYQKFLSRWNHVTRDLNRMFPNRSVINVSDCSKLPDIETISATKFWAEKGLS